ncbi:MAG TPA: DUF1326 domain-containing protein [Fimbriimonadales bacterium]|nr:DUF1326 domain-containing protein [Fimbriimonadales bacterium]
MAILASLTASPGPVKETWSVDADYIEACSCNMFCMCYFNSHPEGEMFCEFNNAIKITKGHVGNVVVDGAKVWLSGDLGGDFTEGMKGAVITYDTGTSQEKKDALKFLISKIYPVKFESFKEDMAPITWEKTSAGGHAKLGDKAEVTLTPIKDASGKQVVIQNLKYWGADKNDGFMLAYGTHFYKGNGYDYSHQKKNGFFITIHSKGDM